MIEVDKITKVYQMGQEKVYALRGVSFSISKGEFVSIMGPSGSGKTTLLQIIGCLDKPTAGRLTLEGTDVIKASDNKLAEIRNQKIGFLFQKFNLLPKATAIENVELPLIYAGVNSKLRRERAIEALGKVGLADRIRHRPNELSGGQRQRVALARALVTRPSFLLADEPTGALDTKTGDQVLELFAQLNEEGNTLVVVTHDSEVAHRTNRVLEIRDGDIVKDIYQGGKSNVSAGKL